MRGLQRQINCLVQRVYKPLRWIKSRLERPYGAGCAGEGGGAAVAARDAVLAGVTRLLPGCSLTLEVNGEVLSANNGVLSPNKTIVSRYGGGLFQNLRKPVVPEAEVPGS